MIDKIIRQHYQDGEKVGPCKRGMEMIMPKLKAQALPQVPVQRKLIRVQGDERLH